MLEGGHAEVDTPRPFLSRGWLSRKNSTCKSGPTEGWPGGLGPVLFDVF